MKHFVTLILTEGFICLEYSIVIITVVFMYVFVHCIAIDTVSTEYRPLMVFELIISKDKLSDSYQTEDANARFLEIL